MKLQVLQRVIASHPLLILIPGLILGQLAFAWDSLRGAFVVLSCMSLQRLCSWRLKPTALTAVTALLIGFLSWLPAGHEPDEIISAEEQDRHVLVISVGPDLDFQSAGQVSFVGEIIARGAPDALQYLSKPLRARFSAQYLPWRDIYSVEPGASFLARAKCKQLQAALYAVSFQASLKRQGILYDCKIQLATALSLTRADSFTRARQSLIEKVLSREWQEESNPRSFESGGVLLAMTIGEKSYINQREKRNFRAWGIGHLLVISGFHIGLFFSWCSAGTFYLLTLLRKFCWYLPAGSMSRLIALGCSGIYVIFTGAEPSALRALFVTAIFCVQSLRGNRVGFFHSFFLSFFLLHLIWPLAVLESGVQLSYAALLGIGLGLRIGNGYSRLIRFVLVSCFASLSSGALAYLIFGEFAPAAFIFNLLFALPLSLTGTGLGIIAELLWLSGIDKSGRLIELVIFLLSRLLEIIRLFAKLFGF